MLRIQPSRLVTDAEIRATYERDRAIREACAAIKYYGQKLDWAGKTEESYFVPIARSFRPSMQLGLDHLRVHASALALADAATNGAERRTYYLAAEELARILDAHDKHKGNFSQKQHAKAVRNTPRAIEGMLRDVIADKGVVKFWKDHVGQKREGKLSANCTIELQEVIEDHFARKHSIQELFVPASGSEGLQR